MRHLLRSLPLLLIFLIPQATRSQDATSHARTAATITSSVLTYHYNNQRSGLNANESLLTQANVAVDTFGKIATYTLDGKVHAQPLYIAETVAGVAQHALYVATEHDTAYRINLDAGTQAWHRSLLRAGETTTPGTGLNGTTAEVGVMATPVIDPSSGPNGAIYLVASSVDSAGKYHQRLHALDLNTGAELFGGPTEIAATFPGTGDNSSGGLVTFDPKQYIERAGLLLQKGILYTTWSSRGDTRPYTGWIIAYSESTLKQTAVLNVTPNGHEGGIWMSGGAPAVDSEGNIYLVDGNGTFDSTFTGSGQPTLGDYGNALLKIDTSAGKLAVTDYYAPEDTYNDISNDLDFGSSGVLILPPLKDAAGKTWNLSVTGSKKGNVYVNNLASLGKYSPKGGVIYQELDGAVPGGAYSTPVYFNNTLYFGLNYGMMRAYAVQNAKITSAAPILAPTFFGYTGPIPVVSANGIREGIVWALDANNPMELHAYNAGNIAQELYNGKSAPGHRDDLGTPFHFSTPVVIDGKVFVGTATGVDVFGLLP